MSNRPVSKPQTGKVNPINTRKYVLSRANYTLGMDVKQVRKNKKYIYVIFLNSKEPRTANIPFYVGETTDIERSLSNHFEVDWHFGQFGTQCIVHVIASVPDQLAQQAITEVTAALVNLKFILHNSRIDNSLRNMKLEDISSYCDLTKKYLPQSLFKTLSKEWRALESQLKSAVNNAMLDNGQRTAPELYRLVTQRTYPSDKSRDLSKVLAKAYNANTGTSSTVFASSELRTDSETIAMAKSAIKGMHGDWYFDGDYIKLGQTIIFKPSKGLLSGKLNNS